MAVTETPCSYYEHNRACHEPAVGELRGHSNFGKHPPWPMCERHIQPKMHPRDLQALLVRYETAGAADGA